MTLFDRLPMGILSFISALFLISSTAAQADIEKIAIPGDKGMQLYWWPKLTIAPGWHQDRDYSLHYGINAITPNDSTFENAETVMYATAIYKPRNTEIKSLKMLIAKDQKDFLDNVPGVQIRETKPITTADGKQFRSFEFFPKEAGNWERVTYGEEGNFFILFTISSRSKAGYEANEGTYENMINLYKTGNQDDKQ